MPKIKTNKRKIEYSEEETTPVTRRSKRIKIVQQDDDDSDIELSNGKQNVEKKSKLRRTTNKSNKKRKKEDEDFVPENNDDDDDDDEYQHELVESDNQSSQEEKPKKDEKKKSKKFSPSSKLMDRLQKMREKREHRERSASSSTIKFDPNVLIFTPNDTTQERADSKRHEEFVRVLKSHVIIEKKAINEEQDGDEDEEQDDSPKKGKQSKVKYTPLEKQVIALKKQYPDVVLFVEVGYKFMFFGKDAEIASKVLGIVAYNLRNFLCASIPTYRLAVHLRRIVDAGYKCGLIRQTETAAVKAAGTNKSGPFERSLEGMFTKGTMVGEEIAEMDDSCGYLCCINEKIINNKNAIISLVSVDVSTGEILYDEFHDDMLRRNMETYLTQIPPLEILVPKNLSDMTQKCIDSNLDVSECGIRIERIDPISYDWGVVRYEIESFYEGDDDHNYLDQLKKRIFGLPESVASCIGVLINYLKDFKLDGMLRIAGLQFKKLSSRFEMSINGTTLKNLEILRNNTNGEVIGSLFWLMNHTCTSFGARLLRHWVCHPLSDIKLINERLDVIEEINNNSASQPIFISSLPIFLRNLPDLEKALMRVQYGKCSPKEFLALLKSLQRLFAELPSQEDIEKLSSLLLKNLLSSIPPELEGHIIKFLDSFNHAAVEKQAGNGIWKRSDLFLDKEGYPEIEKENAELNRLKEELDEHLNEIREILNKPKLNFRSYQGKNNVIEIKVSEMSRVPKDWLKISQTKALVRYQSPFVIRHSKQVQLHAEILESESGKAWNDLLHEFCAQYELLRRTINILATLDCLFSLAELSNKSSYVRPKFITGKPKLEVIDGRHPMIEVLLERELECNSFVPNDAKMGVDGERCMIITGPNMGGKSSYIKSMAVIVLMAHIGVFVPATSCTMTLFDQIFTRMGASDDMCRGQSTFFIELSEAGECLRRATERSLVVMDELGRGTSTHDGTSIAYATLEHLVCNVQCLTLFVTHYPLLTTLASRHTDTIKNYHMSYSDTSKTEVTFLYKLAFGPSPKSYGLNVARLAGLSNDIVQLASEKSVQFEQETIGKMVIKCFERLLKWMEMRDEPMEQVQRKIKELMPNI